MRSYRICGVNETQSGERCSYSLETPTIGKSYLYSHVLMVEPLAPRRGESSTKPFEDCRYLESVLSDAGDEARSETLITRDGMSKL